MVYGTYKIDTSAEEKRRRWVSTTAATTTMKTMTTQQEFRKNERISFIVDEVEQCVVLRQSFVHCALVRRTLHTEFP